MNIKMSQITRTEVLAKRRERYARAGKEHKTKIINEPVELFGCHRKAVIRALQSRPVIAAPFVRGRPKEHDPDQLRPPLKAIWLAALQTPSSANLSCFARPATPKYKRNKISPLNDSFLGSSTFIVGKPILSILAVAKRLWKLARDNVPG
jgi:hypothetical protein